MSAYSFPAGYASADSDVTAVAQTGHGLSVGDWVRMDGTDYVLAQADTDANAEVVGVVSAVAGVDNFTITTGGLVSGLSGLTAGAIHYLDDAVAGAIIDSDTAAVSKPVLIARSTTSGYVFNGFGSGGGGDGSAGTNSIGMSNLGNTSGTTGVVSGTRIRVILVGGNNITLSQSLNGASGTLTISAPATSSLVGVSGASVSTAGSTISIIGSPFSAGVSNVGNTAGDTGITGSRLVFAGTNGITLSESTNASGGTISISGATQTVQTQNLHNVTLSGNTSGAMAQVSSGTMTLAGGNNITLSQAGNAITISGANVGGAQTGISGIANSQTTYTSGTVSLSELGGGITIRSTTGNQFQLSVNSQTAESQSIGMSNLGNTSGTTGIASGAQVRMLFAGAGAVTLSQSLNGASGTLTISAPAQSVQPETQTFLGGLVASNTTWTSGTISISGFGDVTVNTAANLIRISAPVQTAQTGISGLANSQTTYTSGTVSLSELGAITIRSTTGNQYQFSVAAQSVQPETQTFVGGIAGSNTTYTSGTITITGVGGGITVSSNTGQRIDLSVAAPVAQTNQSGGVYAVGNTYSSSSGTYDGRTMSLRGDGIISIAATNSGFRISASQSVQLETQTFIGGISASDTLYTSGSVRFTGVGGGITVSSNTGQRVDLSVAAQSVQPGVQQIVASNASFSSGTVSISGFGDVTVNTAAGIIRISAPVQTAQTGVSGIANSQTTYTSGTVSLSELGAITIRSTTGNQFQLSVNAQTTQTQNLHNVTISGNTSGALAAISSGTMTLAGGNNITLSQAGNAITISGPNVGGAQTGISGIANSQTTFTSGTVSMSELGAITIRSTTGNQYQFSVNAQSVQPETQTFLGGLANSQTTYTSGTVSLSELGAITIRSTTGNQFQLSVNSQTEQTQSRFNLTLSGNTAGAMAQISSGVMTLAGGPNVTVSQAGNAVSISAGAGGAFSAGMSTEGNTAGATGVSGSRMVLVGSGPISLSQTTGAAGNTVSILGPATSSLSAVSPVTISTDGSTISIGASQISAGISGGNTAGDTGVVTGRVVFAGGANITLSGSTNAGSETISIVGGAGGAGYSAGVSNVGNTVGDTGITGSRLVLAGGNNITLSQSTNASGGTVTISAPNAQTAISGIANSQTTYTSGTVSLSELGAITIRSTTGNQYQFSVNAQTAQTGISSIVGSDATYTSGSVQFTGSNMITVKSSANQRIVIDATQSVQPVMNLVVSNTTFSSGTVSISGFGDVTVNTAANIIRISAPTQTVQPGVQHLVASDNTFSSGTVSISGFGDITVNTAGSLIRISGPVQTVESHSIGASNLGNTLGTSGVASGGAVRGIIVGTSNITVSQSVNGASATLSLIGNPPVSAGVSNIGNTGGDTGMTATRFVFVGSNNVTLSQTTGAAGATIGINAGAGGAGGSFSAGASTGGNTAGATGITGTQLVLVGSSPISLSQTTGANGGTVTINAPATSSLVGVPPISVSSAGSTISLDYYNPLADWENMPRAGASLLSHVSAFSKTPIYWNDHLDGDVRIKSLAFAISMVTASQPLSVSAHLGIYTFVNSTSAALLGSLSEAYVVSSASSVSLSGVRNIVMTGIGTHTALSSITAGEYMLGMMFSATATNAMNFSLLGASGGAGPLGGIYPGTNNLSTGTGQGIQVMNGRGSTTVNAMPANVSSADLINQGTAGSQALKPWIYIRS